MFDALVWLTDHEDVLSMAVFVCILGWLYLDRPLEGRVTPERTPDVWP